MHEGSEGDKRKECTSAMRDNEERVHKYRKEEDCGAQYDC